MISSITPPDKLVRQWADSWTVGAGGFATVIATAAAQWGWEQRGAAIEAELQQRADQELEACVEWLDRRLFGRDEIAELRAARRPKPPSKVDLALKSLEGMALPEDAFHTISRAIQRLKELEAAND